MPRTKLGRFSDNPVAYRKSVNCSIKAAMGRCDIPTQKALGEKMGLSELQTCRRFKNGWSDYELFKLNRILQFTEAEQKNIYGGRI